MSCSIVSSIGSRDACALLGQDQESSSEPEHVADQAGHLWKMYKLSVYYSHKVPQSLSVAIHCE